MTDDPEAQNASALSLLAKIIAIHEELTDDADLTNEQRQKLEALLRSYLAIVIGLGVRGDSIMPPQ